ncbi:MAG: radical SAM protein [Desulfuromonadales bacterium]|nr:radical SAM protein [Desulfuromonadales bacterium]
MRIYPVFIAHAGCPHRCLFCAQNRSISQSVVADLESVEGFFEEALPLNGDGEIAFYGGTFTLLPSIQQNQYLTMAGRFVAFGQVAGIRISTRPDALDDRCIARLRASGVTTVEIGCQSFSDSVLKTAGRGHAAVDSISAVRRCLDAGLHVGVQLMPGLPGGDAVEALHSLQQALDLKPSFLRIYPTVVIDGTELADLWKSGGYQAWTLDETVNLCADMLLSCHQVEIPVIRLGLQADPQLDDNLLAGPYHPAFGQLVRSRLWRRALGHAGLYSKKFCVNPHDLSDVMGHRNENRDWLKKISPAVCVTADKTVERGFLRMPGRDLSFIELSAQGGRYD